ncbi:MAG TPA: hypothetical protein VE270_06095, partial [Thermoleophilaceae bacterium]|nr:hypothetical protein [Thermoleophilaceae bacterium]
SARGAEREEALRLVGPAGEASGVSRDEPIGRVLALMDGHGSIDYACAFADGLAGAALTELAFATAGLPDSRDKAFLRSLVLHIRDPAIRGR